MTDIGGIHGNSVWADSSIDQLTRLWREGLSCSKIAAEMGGISRNAVIGKVSRLKLNLQYPRAAPAGTQRRQRVATSHGNNFSLLRARKAAEQRARRLGELFAPEPVPVVEALNSVPCSLLELTRNTCRWPIGDPCVEGFHFCGGLSQKRDEPMFSCDPDTPIYHPYCAHHMREAHLPPKQKSREPRSVPFIQKNWSAT